MSVIKVLIADDHTILREGIRSLLKLEDDIDVVGEAGDGQEAVVRTHELLPDVVLMDVAMPGLGGLEATLEIRKRSPQVKILVLTQYEDPEYVRRFLKAGVSGYVLKKAAGTELVEAIRTVHRGGQYLSPQITGTVIEGFLRGQESAVVIDDYDRLTDREKQVLKLVAEGESNSTIAEMLSLSIKTVMGHREKIMEKLGTHSRTELIKYAIKHGLIRVD
jgi:DNA-binding NarL/FixJ family response regulator